MSSSSAARTIASGGNGVAWLFVIPVVVVGLWVFNAAVSTSWAVHHEAWVQLGDLAVVLVVTGFWYFVVGRISNRRLIRKVRLQVPTSLLVRGIVLRAESSHWLREQTRSGATNAAVSSGSAVVVITPSSIEIWTHSRADVYPLGAVDWERITDVEPVGTSPLSSKIAFRIHSPRDSITISVLSDHTFSRLMLRGAVRRKFIRQVEALRVGLNTKGPTNDHA